MKRRYKILISILLILAIGFILIFTYRVEIGSQFVPEIENDTLHISIKKDTADISIKLFAENKIFVPYRIDSVNYKIRLFDKIYDHGVQHVNIDLGRYGRDTFSLNFRIPLTELLADLKEARKRIPNGDCMFFLEIHFKHVIGSLRIPIKISAKLRIPPPPQIDVIGVDFGEINLKNVRAKLEIKLTNFLTTRIKIQSLHYTISIPEHGSAIGQYVDLITVKPQSDLIIHLPLIIKWEHLEKTLADVISDNDTYNFQIYVLTVIAPENSESKPLIIKYTETKRFELKTGKLK